MFSPATCTLPSTSQAVRSSLPAGTSHLCQNIMKLMSLLGIRTWSGGAEQDSVAVGSLYLPLWLLIHDEHHSQKRPYGISYQLLLSRPWSSDINQLKSDPMKELSRNGNSTHPVFLLCETSGCMQVIFSSLSLHAYVLEVFYNQGKVNFNFCYSALKKDKLRNISRKWSIVLINWLFLILDASVEDS